jgi:hypothetical protein
MGSPHNDVSRIKVYRLTLLFDRMVVNKRLKEKLKIICSAPAERSGDGALDLLR